MQSEEYQQAVIGSENTDIEAIRARINVRLLHAISGIMTESGELMDAFKRNIIYGKNLDRVNLIEELGDLTWYIALALDEIDSSFAEVFEANIAKLKKRYKTGKFNETEAINRNLEAEREALCKTK
jgi:NTP pyrophosphatase (non-canonical NTP hydrolase)